EETKNAYETKLNEYKQLVLSLNEKSDDYNKKKEQITKLENELMNLEEEYRKNIESLNTIKYDNAQIQQFITSFVSSINNINQQYWNYLDQLSSNKSNEISQIGNYLSDLSAKMFNLKNQIINSNFIDSNNGNSLNYLLGAKEQIYSHLVQTFKTDDEQNNQQKFIEVEKITDFKEKINSLAIDSKAKQNQQLYSLLMQLKNAVETLEKGAIEKKEENSEKGENTDQINQIKKVVDRINSYNVILPYVYKVFSYIDISVSAYKEALEEYLNSFYSNINTQQNENDEISNQQISGLNRQQINEKINNIFNENYYQQDLATLKDIKNYFETKGNILDYEKPLAQDFINSIQNNKIINMTFNKQLASLLQSIVSDIESYSKEKDNNKKEELNSIIKNNIIDFIENILTSMSEGSDETEKIELQKFILSFLNIRITEENKDIKVALTENPDSISIEQLDYTKNAIFMLCSLGIYNDISKIIKTQTINTGDTQTVEEIADIDARMEYLKQYFPLFQSIGVIKNINDSSKDLINANNSFNWIIENLKKFYYKFFDDYIKNKEKNYETTLVEKFNYLFNNNQQINNNQQTTDGSQNQSNIISSTLRELLIQNENISYAKLLLQKSIVSRQFENIGIANNLLKLNNICENLNNFINEIYDYEKSFLNKVNESSLLGSDDYLTKIDEQLGKKYYNAGQNNNNYGLKGFLNNLRGSTNPADFEQYLILTTLLNHFYSFNDLDRSLYALNNIKMNIKNKIFTNLLKGQSGPTQSYTQNIYAEAINKINELKNIENTNGQNILNLILEKINSNQIDAEDENWVSDNNDFISSEDIGLIIKNILKDNEVWQNNPLLNGYYNEIVEFFIQNIVSAVHLSHKADIIKNGQVDFEKFYTYFDERLDRICGADSENIKNAIKNAIIEQLFQGKKFEENEKIFTSLSNIVQSISNYYGNNGFEYERWYNDRIKHTEDGNVVAALLNNQMNKDINNDIDKTIKWDSNLRNFLAVPTIVRLTSLINTEYFTGILTQKEQNTQENPPYENSLYTAENVLLNLIKFYLSYEYKYNELINELNQSGDINKLNSINDYILKVFEDNDLNNAIETVFKDKAENVKESIISRIIYEIKMRLDVEQVNGVKERFNQYLQDYIKNKGNGFEFEDIYNSKNNFDEFVNYIQNYNDNQQSNGEWIKDEDIVNLKKDKILEIRFIYASKLLSPMDTKEDIEYIAENCGLDQEFLGFLYEMGLLKKEYEGDINSGLNSYLLSTKSQKKIEKYIEDIQNLYENSAKNHQKIDYQKRIEQYLMDCINQVDIRQTLYSYIKYENENEGITKENVLEKLRNGQIDEQTAKSIIATNALQIDFNNNDQITNFLNRVWLEKAISYNDNNEGSESLGQIAKMYVSEIHAANMFIESQNKLIRIIIALDDLIFVNSFTNDEVEGKESGFIQLLNSIISASKSSDFTEISQNLSELGVNENNLNNYFDSYISIATQKLEGSGLINMLQKMIEAKNNIKEQNLTVSSIEEKISSINNDINNKKNEIQNAKDQLKALQNEYNGIVESINSKVKKADEAYFAYLKAKEIYFFCVNIYADGKDLSSAIDMYKSEVAKYTRLYEQERAKYEIGLTIFKMNENEKNSKKWDSTASIEQKNEELKKNWKIYYLLTAILDDVKTQINNLSLQKDGIEKKIKETLADILIQNSNNNPAKSDNYEKNLNDAQKDVVDKLAKAIIQYFNDNDKATFADLEKIIEDGLNSLFTMKYMYVTISVNYVAEDNGNFDTGSGNDNNIHEGGLEQTHNNGGQTTESLEPEPTPEQIQLDKSLSMKKVVMPFIDDEEGGTGTGGGQSNTGNGSTGSNNNNDQTDSHFHEPIDHDTILPEKTIRISLSDYIYYNSNKKGNSDLIEYILNEKKVRIEDIVEIEGKRYIAQTNMDFTIVNDSYALKNLKLKPESCAFFTYNSGWVNQDTGAAGEIKLALNEFLKTMMKNVLDNISNIKSAKDIANYLKDNATSDGAEGKYIEYSEDKNKQLKTIADYFIKNKNFMGEDTLSSLAIQLKTIKQSSDVFRTISYANSWYDWARQTNQNNGNKKIIEEYLNKIFDNNNYKQDILNLIKEVVNNKSSIFGENDLLTNESITLEKALNKFNDEIKDKEIELNIIKESAKEKYNNLRKEYEEKLEKYSNYKGLLAAYMKERSAIEVEIELTYVNLQDEKKECLKQIYTDNDNDWNKVDIT
ncbi:MAG: hypothetical protein WH035_01200, partial [Spirochaetota bacterium]